MSDENENSRSAELSAPAIFDPAFGPTLAPVEPTEPTEAAEPAEAAPAGFDAQGIPFAGAPPEWFNAGTPRTLPGEIQSLTIEASVRVAVEPARTQVFEPDPVLYRDPITDFRTPARRRLASMVGK